MGPHREAFRAALRSMPETRGNRLALGGEASLRDVRVPTKLG